MAGTRDAACVAGAFSSLNSCIPKEGNCKHVVPSVYSLVLVAGIKHSMVTVVYMSLLHTDSKDLCTASGAWTRVIDTIVKY